MLEKILSLYGIAPGAIVQPFGEGLINNTWKVNTGDKEFILQKINDKVFINPENIASNIDIISDYLKDKYPEYLFVSPVKALDGKTIIYINDQGYFRLFPFVKNSKTYTVITKPEQAFEAAKQFALFTKNLRSLPIESLKITLPDFHNLDYRYQQFQQSLQEGNSNRIKETGGLIAFLETHSDIVKTYNTITKSKAFKQRVIHHDTKISNVLFDQNDKGLCVIDLDTVMPGYFISDIGDMMRTYLSPVSEEEKDFDKIDIREDFFRGIAEGYFSEMADELSLEEVDHFVYSGLFLIYMQALRFLTDYLNNDRYYGSAYEGHNLVRTQNQVILLERLMAKANQFREIIMKMKKQDVK